MPTFRDILIDHNTRYPKWQIADLYKLLHQGAMGSEHAVTDIDHARNWLENELAHLNPVPTGEPLIDPISSDGAIVRVNLRPYIRSSLDPALLLDAFVLTSCSFRGSTLNLEEGWKTAALLCAEGLLPFDSRELEDFCGSLCRQGFPAVHHSEPYESYYHPAYRVAAVRCLPPEITEQIG